MTFCFTAIRSSSPSLSDTSVALDDEITWRILMQNLPVYLDDDGLVRYFPSKHQGTPVLTSYLLALGHEVDWEIPSDSLNKMVAGLRGFIEGSVIRRSPLSTADLSVRIVSAVEALSRYGRADAKLLSALTISPNLWPTSAVAEAILSFAEVRGRYRSSSARLLDREGRLLHEIRVDEKSRRLDWLTLAEISPGLIQACIQAEDRRFREHGGVDWRALASALHQTLVKGRARGASTISMQLASLLYPDLRSRKRQRSLSQKGKQMWLASGIEGGWSKTEILEAYLNLVDFRGELQGISAASWGLFGKAAHGLDASESLVLACLIRAPSAAEKDVLGRARYLAGLMNWRLEEARIRQALKRAVDGGYYIRPQSDLAPHVARRLLRSDSPAGNSPRDLLSTLDAQLQRFCLQTLQRKLLEIRSRKVQDGSLMVVENRTGEVPAYLGNAADVSSARHVDGVQARRQAGSTLKPFLYGLAFAERLLTPASLIDDSPIDISLVNGIYRPSL